MKAEYHPAAKRELERSVAWYAERSPQAAVRFARAVRATVREIESQPERFVFLDRRNQACTVERFPFQIIFRQDPDRIFLVAVAHAKRRPGYWKHRR